MLQILHEPCTDRYFSNKTNAEVLRMNRSGPIGLLFKGLLVLLTLPLSLSLLILWSFKTRGTWNFLKSDGVLFLEQLIPLCTNWVEPPLSPASEHILSRTPNLTARSQDPMPTPNHSYYLDSTTVASIPLPPVALILDKQLSETAMPSLYLKIPNNKIL